MEVLTRSKSKSSVKVLVTMRTGYEIYSRDMLSHYITSQFLRRDKDLAHDFYAVGKNTTSWTSSNAQKGWFGGKWCFDIQWKDYITADRLINSIESINSILETCRIDAVIDSAPNLEPSIKDTILYAGTINKSMSVVKDKMSMFDWNVRVAVKGMGILEWETKFMPELKEKILFHRRVVK